MHVPVDRVALPRFVELPLMVHVEYGLQEAAAQPPEIGVFLSLPQVEPRRPVPEWERRAVGSALCFEVC